MKKRMAKGKKSVQDLAVGQPELVTGKSPEPAGRNACLTSGERSRLMALLEGYGVSVAGFDALRSDAYEKHIAARSLTELETVYSALLRPGAGYEKAQAECPGWGKDNKPPGITTLRVIKQRIMNEQAIRERVQSDGFVADEEKVQNPRSKAPSLGTAEYFESAARTLSRELLNAKLDGQPIMENLRTFDRLLKVGSMRVRERRETRETARFDWERGGREIEKKPAPPNPAYKAVRLNKAEREVLDSLRIMCMIEGIYGKRPEEQRQEKIREMVERMKTCVEEVPTIKRVPSKRRPVTGTNIKAGTNDEDLAVGQPEPAADDRRHKNACPASAEATKNGKAEGQNAQGAQEQPRVVPSAVPIPEKTGAQISAEAEERRQRVWQEQYERQKAQLRAQATEWG